MRAAVLTALGGSVRLEDIAVPRPGRGQVLFKIAASGVCFTDIKVGQALAAKTPLVPGHEPVGVVHTLGDGVAGRRDRRRRPSRPQASRPSPYCPARRHITERPVAAPDSRWLTLNLVIDRVIQNDGLDVVSHRGARQLASP
ncbi:alcohol dehydrogenase catalytic domain-containing protein [Mycobacteroides abscessus]|uniref:alcohol dehydrogenase catalytic domain-containing protein n=1 Tax=Mycobacteroides abscessus TaxID=36809 RepID=UPI000940D1EC